MEAHRIPSDDSCTHLPLVSSCRDKLHMLQVCLFLQVPACFYSEYSRFVFLFVSYRIIHGIGKPDEVLECIERGVDIFESFFPFQVTERGCALVFSYDCHPDPEAAGRLLDGRYNFYCISQYCGKHNSCFAGIYIWGFCSWNKCSNHWKNRIPLLSVAFEGVVFWCETCWGLKFATA